MFSRQAHRIELDYADNALDETRAEHQAYVIGSIFSSVAFLEAQINELFDRLSEKNTYNVKISDTQEKTILIVKEMIKERRYGVTYKYDLALQCLDKEKFDASSKLIHDVKTLRDIRNELIHYQPKWIRVIEDGEPTKTRDNIEKQLKDVFPINPLSAAGDSFFPDKCLGHGCSEWAIKTSLTYSEEFFRRANMTLPYDHIKQRLEPSLKK